MRPIDADALIQAIGKLSFKDMSGGELAMVFHIHDMISDAPTLDYAPKWISVNDKLPKEREDVVILIRLDDCDYYRVGWWRGENVEWMQAGLGLIEGTVTHWMPLPEAPKEE